jgi:protein tyrosine/serine phosphatase
MSIGDIYTFMLREYAERFGAVLRVIADPAAHPLVFHCAAGKDRTGLVAMLVLELCGVPDETVVADFAFTESRMPEVIARHTARAASDEAVEVAAQQFGAEAVTMQAVLATLREHHGSVESYVRSTGVDDDEIDALRTALVEETSGWSRPRPE